MKDFQVVELFRDYEQEEIPKFYAKNDVARLFCSLVDKYFLTQEDVKKIRKLGFSITFEYEPEKS